MAFGQQSGIPASARQVKDLLALLQDAGYAGFRDARGPLGFTQRQGGGKFTSAEAAALIEQLQAEADGGGPFDGDDGAPGPPPTAGRPAKPAPARAPKAGPVRSSAAADASKVAAEKREARQAAVMREMPARMLAVELERRGWIVIPPEDLTAPDPGTEPG